MLQPQEQEEEAVSLVRGQLLAGVQQRGQPLLQGEEDAAGRGAGQTGLVGSHPAAVLELGEALAQEPHLLGQRERLDGGRGEHASAEDERARELVDRPVGGALLGGAVEPGRLHGLAAEAAAGDELEGGDQALGAVGGDRQHLPQHQRPTSTHRSGAAGAQVQVDSSRVHSPAASVAI